MRHLNRETISVALSVEWSGSHHRAQRRVFPAPWEMLISRTPKWVAACRRVWRGPSRTLLTASSRMNPLCPHLAPRHLHLPRRALRARSVFTTHHHTLLRRTVLILIHTLIILLASLHQLLSSNSQCNKLAPWMPWQHTECRHLVQYRRPRQAQWVFLSRPRPFPAPCRWDSNHVVQVQTRHGGSISGYGSSKQSATPRSTAHTISNRSSRGGQADSPARSSPGHRCPRPCRRRLCRAHSRRTGVCARRRERRSSAPSTAPGTPSAHGTTLAASAAHTRRATRRRVCSTAAARTRRRCSRRASRGTASAATTPASPSAWTPRCAIRSSSSSRLVTATATAISTSTPRRGAGSTARTARTGSGSSPLARHTHGATVATTLGELAPSLPRACARAVLRPGDRRTIKNARTSACFMTVSSATASTLRIAAYFVPSTHASTTLRHTTLNRTPGSLLPLHCCIIILLCHA